MAGIRAAIFASEVEADVEKGRLTREEERGFPIPIVST